jgi:hypothetical protein
MAESPRALALVTDPTITIINPAEDPAYPEQVTAVAEALQAGTQEEVNATRGQFIGHVGGFDAANSVNFWESVRTGEARIASQQISEAVGVTQDLWANSTGEGDAADRVITAVARDARGTTDPTRVDRGDIVDFSAGSSLTDMIESGEIQDPAILLKATAAARLLIEQGIYKFTKWGSGDQLEQALSVIEQFAERVPAFDINMAGIGRARSALVRSVAALHADNITKPNFLYAMPERGYLHPTAIAGLRTVERITAHKLLQETPFDELMGAAEQPEVEATATKGAVAAEDAGTGRHRK